MLGIDIATPVSYTHLDVYKRQYICSVYVFTITVTSTQNIELQRQRLSKVVKENFLVKDFTE